MAKTRARYRKPVKNGEPVADAALNRGGEKRGSGSTALTFGGIALILLMIGATAYTAMTLLKLDTGLNQALRGMMSPLFTLKHQPENDDTIASNGQNPSHQKPSSGRSAHAETPKKLDTSDELGANELGNDSSDVDQQHNRPNSDFKETILKGLSIQKILVDGRSVIGKELIGTKKRPTGASIRVYQFENFLTDRECNGLIQAHRNHVAQLAEDPIVCFDSVETLRKHLKKTQLKNIKVSNRDFTEGTTCVNASFSHHLKSILGWSYSTAFYPGESGFTEVFDGRVNQATRLKPSNGGKYQITSYSNGIGYKSHTDCTLGNTDLRDRVATILVYLQDVESGGQTEFPELGISVTPRKGRAITWNNQRSDGRCDPYSLHVAQPVIKGQKIILQRWYYYKNFYMLGKRPAEPELPTRTSLQPMVSCDEYDHGSCRWYDEWNYDHLTDYMRVRKELQ